MLAIASRARVRRAALPRLAAFAAALTLLGTAQAVAGDDHDDRGGRHERHFVPRIPAPTALTRHQLPFACQEVWVGSTRASHSPDPNSVDFNRTDDLGSPVVASAFGRVIRASPKIDGGYGRWVEVEHPGGESSVYAHLDTVVVRVGQYVDQGTLLGTVGATGRVTGAHLHYEQKVGKRVAAPVFNGVPLAWNQTRESRNCADVPLAGNLTDGPEADVSVWRRGTRPTLQAQAGGVSTILARAGRPTDEPVLGDFDGNGVADLALRGPRSRMFSLMLPSGVTTIVFGSVGDRPVAGDWDGDGRFEVGVRRVKAPEFWLRLADGTTQVVPLGDSDDLPVTGDWNGDRRTDLGVFDVATAVFTLYSVDAAGAPTTWTVPFGTPGQLPVAGDWDANGRTDLATWDRATATFAQRRAPSIAEPVTEVRTLVFGRPR